MLHALKDKRKQLRDEITNWTCPHIVWMISILPKLGGFPFFEDTLYVPIWVVHLTLVTYVYLIGVLFYQMSDIDMVSAISSILNLLVAAVVYNNSFWLLFKRKEIRSILNLALENDALVTCRGKFLDIYRILMKRTKIIVMICYSFHFINEGILYIPRRAFDMSSFSISNCVGMEPLTRTPDREACMIIIVLQELSSLVVMASYDVIFLFVYAHTTIVLLILCRDIEDFYKTSIKFDGTPKMLSEVRKTLKNFVHRHTLVLLTVNTMQNLFSITIGTTLVLNIISVCTFFVMPIEVALSFTPLIALTFSGFFVYCFLGQRLFNAALDFEIAVYSCGWENLHPREQRVVYLMLQRSQEPVVLNAAGMIPIVLSTFATSMQTIYKFITVFRV